MLASVWKVILPLCVCCRQKACSSSGSGSCSRGCPCTGHCIGYCTGLCTGPCNGHCTGYCTGLRTGPSTGPCTGPSTDYCASHRLGACTGPRDGPATTGYSLQHPPAALPLPRSSAPRASTLLASLKVAHASCQQHLSCCANQGAVCFGYIRKSGKACKSFCGGQRTTPSPTPSPNPQPGARVQIIPQLAGTDAPTPAPPCGEPARIAGPMADYSQVQRLLKPLPLIAQ